MYIQVTFSLFCDMFQRVNRDNNFSYEAKKALFDYLESFEDNCDLKIDLDIIALCCEFSEYSLEDALEVYNCEDLDELCNNYNVIIVDDETVIVGE